MREYLLADLLIPGRGDPIVAGAVVLEQGMITYAGPSTGAPVRATDDTVTELRVLMPGLWDCHTHFVGSPDANLEKMASLSPVTAAARAVADAGALLDGGVTSVRDVGGLGLKLAPAAADGSMRSPKIHAAGRILSTTGGHADIHSLPLDMVHEVACNHGFSILCDGVPEVTKAVRINLRDNAKLIKVCASGGVMSEIDHPMHQQFSDEELRAIVEEAARAERIVA
ncbi:MAG: imidazolonepropionase-like amidohydrolase, partial [Verrucomicrobiales bacterium]